MGQTINVETRTAGSAAIFDADRSLTGQDGEAYTDIEEARSGEGFGAALAVDIFESDAAVDHVYVGSNGIVVVRPSGWDDQSVKRVETAISEFFVFYRDGEVETEISEPEADAEVVAESDA